MDTKIALGIIFFAAISAPLVFAMWRIGDETLRQLAFLVVGGILVIGMMLAGAVMIRASKKKDPTDVTHHVRDGTRTIVQTKVLDGRSQGDVRLLQLPQVSSQAVFPEMLHAAYQSGVLARRGTAAAPEPGPGDDETVEGEVLREWDPGEWGGEIHD